LIDVLRERIIYTVARARCIDGNLSKDRNKVMARRNNSGLFEMFMLLCQLPCWVTLIAGAGIYAYRSTLEKPAGFSVEMPAVAWYVLPIFQWLFLGAAVISAINALGRRMLFKAAKDIDAIRAMSWREFENLVGEFYRRQGFRVEMTGGGGADGGVDLLLRRNGETVIVQCKQWRTFKVGVSIVREMYGVMVAEHADRVIVVTSGRYTGEAFRFARGKPIDLVDGTELARMIRDIRRDAEMPTSPSSPAVPTADGSVDPGSRQEPHCPLCGSPMIRRTARRGTNAGNTFWGCARFPDCRGIRNE
jgi:restriction system protein